MGWKDRYLFEAGDFGIADVGAVDEAEEVD
jgi:hypothetical protein